MSFTVHHARADAVEVRLSHVADAKDPYILQLAGTTLHLSRTDALMVMHELKRLLELGTEGHRQAVADADAAMGAAQ